MSLTVMGSFLRLSCIIFFLLQVWEQIYGSNLLVASGHALTCEVISHEWLFIIVYKRLMRNRMLHFYASSTVQLLRVSA